MANKWLIGNGRWCKPCRGTGVGSKKTDVFEYGDGSTMTFYELCPTCNGQKRLAAEPSEIIAGRVKRSRAPDPSCFLGIVQYDPPTPQASD